MHNKNSNNIKYYSYYQMYQKTRTSLNPQKTPHFTFFCMWIQTPKQ